MARQRYGIVDGYRGSVGPVIGYMWRGRWCLRSRPVHVHNPRTEPQQRNRERFRQTVLLASRMKEALRVGMHAASMAAGMTECNLFCRMNCGLIGAEGGNMTVDHARLQLSCGPVAGVAVEAVEADGEGAIALTFSSEGGSGADRVRVYAWCEEREECLLAADVARREGAASVALPEGWCGCTAHLYLFASDYRGRASATAYGGSVAWEEDEAEKKAAPTAGNADIGGSPSKVLAATRTSAARPPRGGAAAPAGPD